MFAYCGNNPVNCYDPSGHYFSVKNLYNFEATDGPDNCYLKKRNIIDENSKPLLEKLYSLGFSEPQGAIIHSIKVTEEEYNRTRIECFGEKVDFQLQKTFMTMGITYVYTFAYIFVSAIELTGTAREIPDPGLYTSYIVEIEYDIRNPITQGYEYFYEKRTYILTSYSNGEKYIYLTSFSKQGG